MGYLRDTDGGAIKSSIPRTVTETGNADRNNSVRTDNAQLEIRQPPSLNADYLRKDINSSDASAYVARRRMFEVNGAPLDHWKINNFETKRDATCRIVYKPKIGIKFFQKALRDEDYTITRSLTTSLEQPYFSKYNRFFPTQGHFCCKACGNPLYSSKAKFDVDDGWPAFGACVLGSIGVTSVEERVAHIEKQEQACIKIQAFVRGYQCRYRVQNMLDELIDELLRKKHARMRKESVDDWSTQEGHTSSDFSSSLSCFSFSSSSDDIDSSRKSKGSNGGYVLSRALGDDYAEIHCHRCKSHLGDVFAQGNTGKNGEKYRERHRVNGRALKYMDVDLPKRTNAEASLLFANSSQRRRFGLPHTEGEGELVVSPFGTLHWMDKAPNRLSVSNHEHNSKIDIQRKPSDQLSKSSHPWPFQRMKIPDVPTTKVTESKISNQQTDTNNRRRPMRRGSTDTSINIAERAELLENEFTNLYSYANE